MGFNSGFKGLRHFVLPLLLSWQWNISTYLSVSNIPILTFFIQTDYFLLRKAKLHQDGVKEHLQLLTYLLMRFYMSSRAASVFETFVYGTAIIGIDSFHSHNYHFE